MSFRTQLTYSTHIIQAKAHLLEQEDALERLQDVEEEVVGQPTPEERGALLLAKKPRVEPHGTLQQPEQRSRLPQPLQLLAAASRRAT